MQPLLIKSIERTIHLKIFQPLLHFSLYQTFGLPGNNVAIARPTRIRVPRSGHLSTASRASKLGAKDQHKIIISFSLKTIRDFKRRGIAQLYVCKRSHLLFLL